MRRIALVLLIASPTLLFAETVRAIAPRPVSVRQLARDSGRIFSGVVLRVDHMSADANGAAGITRVTFRVENAIRAVRRGQLVEVREWDGLWNAGERYVPGEHVLLFLYPNSKLGLTSPVGGAAGRYRVDGAGQVLSRVPSAAPIKPVGIHTFAAQIRRAARGQ